MFRYAARVEVYLKGKPQKELCSQLTDQKPAACAFERVTIKKAGDTWSVGLTKEDAERFVWVKPNVKVVVRFTEWTRAGVLRHAGLVSIKT